MIKEEEPCFSAPGFIKSEYAGPPDQGDMMDDNCFDSC